MGQTSGTERQSKTRWQMKSHPCRRSSQKCQQHIHFCHIVGEKGLYVWSASQTHVPIKFDHFCWFMTYTEGFSVQLSPLCNEARPMQSRVISKGMHQRRKVGFWVNCWVRSLGPGCNSGLCPRLVTAILTGRGANRVETPVHYVHHCISFSWLCIPESV